VKIVARREAIVITLNCIFSERVKAVKNIFIKYFQENNVTEGIVTYMYYSTIVLTRINSSVDLPVRWHNQFTMEKHGCLERRWRMKKTLFIGSALYFFLVMVTCNSLNSFASDVVGDVNNNGKVGLEEGIYALQVAAGMSPSTILDSSAGPHRAAWATYSYSAGTLAGEFIFSTFVFNGPELGSFEVDNVSITSTQLVISDTEIWNREDGVPGDIVGRWERTDSENNTFTVTFDSNGSFLYTAKGDMYLEVVNVPVSTKTIDGEFNDWSGSSSLNLYSSKSDCGSVDGRTITSVSLAQDDAYIYVKMALNGPYDSTFRYKLGEIVHIRVVPPLAVGLAADCGLASPVGGERSGSAAFGTGDSENPPDNRHLLECRVNKCLARMWEPTSGAFRVWADQDDSSVCRSTSNLPIINFDFSTCH
jgi:hypothetical protein